MGRGPDIKSNLSPPPEIETPRWPYCAAVPPPECGAMSPNSCRLFAAQSLSDKAERVKPSIAGN